MEPALPVRAKAPKHFVWRLATVLAAVVALVLLAAWPVLKTIAERSCSGEPVFPGAPECAGPLVASAVVMALLSLASAGGIISALMWWRTSNQ